MNKVLLLALLGLSFSCMGQNCEEILSGSSPNGGNCCEDCTCSYCAEIACCENSPFYFPGDCGPGGTAVCEAGPNACTTFFENNVNGVTNANSQSPSNPNGCIPIDGGMGFLIAGGLGIGIIGIRRRKGEVELECS